MSSTAALLIQTRNENCTFHTEPKGPVITPDIKIRDQLQLCHLEDISSQCHLTPAPPPPKKNPPICVKFLNKQSQAPAGELHVKSEILVRGIEVCMWELTGHISQLAVK